MLCLCRSHREPSRHTSSSSSLAHATMRWNSFWSVPRTRVTLSFVRVSARCWNNADLQMVGDMSIHDWIRMLLIHLMMLLDPIELRESVFNKLNWKVRGDFVKITLKIIELLTRNWSRGILIFYQFRI